MASDLSRLLRPKSIAVFGGGWARNVIQQCKAMGFEGEIWPVHPTKAEILGLPCYTSAEELPEAPDAAFVGVNRHATIGVVQALSQRGAGGAVCFASGFSESAKEDGEGEDLQQALLDAAQLMPIIGPNCYGLINYLDGALLWPDQHGGQREKRGVAILTQSSNIAINMTMQRRALPIAYVITAGNQAQQSIAALGAALLEDERVTVLGLHIEGFGNLRAFEQLAARARELGKPIIALKVGRSSQARAAMISHTNSLAGEEAGAQAFLDRLGIARVYSVPAFLETLKLLHMVGPLKGRSIASMSCSGGEASLMADSAERRNLYYPPLSDTQKAQLRSALGPLVALANPLDYHTFIWNDLAAMTATFTAMMKDGADLTFLVLEFPRTDRCSNEDWMNTIEAIAAAKEATGKAVAVLTSMAENLPELIALALVKRGIVPMFGIDEALEAADAAAGCGEFLGYSNGANGNQSLSGTEPSPFSLREKVRMRGSKTEVHFSIPSPQPSPGRRGGSVQKPDSCSDSLLLSPILLPSISTGTIRLFPESEAKTLLYKAGLRTPKSETAETPEQAGKAAKAIGFPVVLKGMGIAHKTESNAVRLNLQSTKETVAAAQEMTEIAQGFLIEEQVTNTVAELLVGVVKDPAHGFVLTIAAGGILTELLEDAISLLLPVTEQDIRKALSKLKIIRLLNGYRGKPGARIDAIVSSIQSLANFVAAHQKDIEEVEINPLLCGEHTATVADALIRMRVQHD